MNCHPNCQSDGKMGRNVLSYFIQSTLYPKELKWQSWHITVPIFIILYIKIPFHICTQLFHKELSMFTFYYLTLTSCIRGNLVIFIVVPCCMLFQSLCYCSNSCTSLHFKILKSPTKTLKIRPYMFQSPLKPSSGCSWPYFARLLNWNVDLHLL
jgi:hypothetical protein